MERHRFWSRADYFVPTTTHMHCVTWRLRTIEVAASQLATHSRGLVSTRRCTKKVKDQAPGRELQEKRGIASMRYIRPASYSQEYILPSVAWLLVHAWVVLLLNTDQETREQEYTVYACMALPSVHVRQHYWSIWAGRSPWRSMNRPQSGRRVRACAWPWAPETDIDAKKGKGAPSLPS
jgi:hypothetical protein